MPVKREQVYVPSHSPEIVALNCGSGFRVCIGVGEVFGVDGIFIMGELVAVIVDAPGCCG